MKTHGHNILSIVLGTRYIGVAIFNDSDLRDWFIKSLNGKTLKEKIKNLVGYGSDYIERFNIDVVAIKKMHSSRSSLALTKLNESIKNIGRQKHLAIIEYPISAIEKTLLSGKTNKRLLTEEVLIIYPVVYHEYEREKKNKSRYLTRMFEAIAMGVVCFQNLGTRQRKVVQRVH
ncbi:MAG: hypothetical protein NTX65_05065 [Ignavibacteriales bacterium]|nr:hypothetical protein [Ignavibacteriales bacterium]